MRRRPWFGRDADLAGVRALVDRVGIAVVTGPPGIGKSRLLAEVARGWPAEVLEVSLDGVADAGEVVVRVATALGIGTVADPPVGAALAGRPGALVVLDEADRVAPRLGELLATWARAAPNLRCLVGSRVRVEAALDTWILGPLGEDDAVALFVDRSRAVQPDLGMDLDQVRAAVRTLDGLPLAVELAAARVRLFPPASLADRLPGTLGALNTAIAASWALLAEPQQRALAACSVFRATFDLAAFEAVTGADAAELEALLDASLIQLVEPGRMRLLASVRSFVAPHLADPDRIGLGHARWVVDAARDRIVACRSTGDWSALEVLRDDLQDAVNRGGPDATPAALALGELTEVHGPFGDPTLPLDVPPDLAVDVLRFRLGRLAAAGRHAEALQLLVSAPSPRTGRERLVLLERRLVHLTQLYRFADAEAVLVELEQVAPGVDAPRLQAEVWISVGLLRHRQGRGPEALAAFDRARTAMGLTRDARLEAQLAAATGLALRPSDYDRAGQHIRRSVELYRALGPQGEARALGVLGVHLHDGGDLVGAADALVHAARLAARLGDRWSEANALRHLLMVRVEERDWDQVERVRERIVARTTDPALLADVRWAEGVSAWLRGEDQAAAGPIADAISALEAVGHRTSPTVYRAFLAAAVPDEALLARAERDAEALGPAFALLPALVRESRAGGLTSETRARASDRPGSYARLLLSRLDLGVRVAADGAWFETGPTSRVDLGRRPMLQRFLAALAAAGQGEWIGREELIAAAWPGERLVGGSADTRLHTAVRTLRKLGLGAALQTGEREGELAYRLDDAVQVRPYGVIVNDALSTPTVPPAPSGRSTWIL